MWILPIGQNGEASRWRVCYQRGLPRLVSEGYGKKLDGVGPIDNRPSTKQLQHFEEEKNKIKKT